MAKSKGGAKTAVWILMGLLILGLGGFGATSFSSSVRSVGSVGDQDITTADYGRALQNEMRALEAQTGQSISFEQVETLGIDGQVLNRLIADAAVDSEASRVGLSVGDETLAKQLRGIPAFTGVDGKFDRDAYKFALDRAGLGESEFEDSIRRETARALVQGAVVSGRALPAPYIDTVLQYFAERRRVTWARVDSSQLNQEVFEPSEEELRALYQDEIESFTRPEMKRITYAWLTPEMIMDQVEVDETLLREAYEDRRAEYNRPERRLVERLIYADEGRAAQARDALDNGSATFDALVEARGLTLDDIDMGVSQVLRGEDHVSNTAVQIQIFTALFAAGFAAHEGAAKSLPQFAHEALLVGKEGKLSKRLGSLGCDAFREAGIEPEAIIALLARLGTSQPIEPIADRALLTQSFDLATFGRAPAKFDEADLERINAAIVHQLPFDAVKERLPEGMDEAGWHAVQPNLAHVHEAAEWWRLVTGPIEAREFSQEDRAYLAEAAETLTWGDNPWGALTMALKEATGRKGKALFLPLRQALTGMDHGPDMGELLPLIGEAEARARLRAAAG